VQLLPAQIPKAQKDTDDLTVIFLLLGSQRIKSVRKMLVKSTPAIFIELPLLRISNVALPTTWQLELNHSFLHSFFFLSSHFSFPLGGLIETSRS